MAKVNGAEFAEKWGRNLQNAAQDIQRGVERTTKNPMEEAAKRADKWLQNTQAAKQKFVDRLSATPKEAWTRGMLDKGLSRLSTGVAGAQAKMQDFGEQLISHIEAGERMIENEPDLTVQDSKNRMIKWFDHMQKFRRK